MEPWLVGGGQPSVASDQVGRAAVLKNHTRGVRLGEEADLNNVPSQTPELVGAQLRKLVHATALPAARRDPKSVTQSDLTDALEKGLLGRPEESSSPGSIGAEPSVTRAAMLSGDW